MIALALTVAASTAAATKDAFVCEYVASGSPHTPPREDFRLERTGLWSENSAWTIVSPDSTPTPIESFTTRSISPGGSVGLRWEDQLGKRQDAFILFKDAAADGSRSVWVSMGHPAPWHLPGFFCATRPTASGKGTQ